MEAKLLVPGSGPAVPFPAGILRLTKLKALVLDVPCHVRLPPRSFNDAHKHKTII